MLHYPVQDGAAAHVVQASYWRDVCQCIGIVYMQLTLLRLVQCSQKLLPDNDTGIVTVSAGTFPPAMPVMTCYLQQFLQKFLRIFR